MPTGTDRHHGQELARYHGPERRKSSPRAGELAAQLRAYMVNTAGGNEESSGVRLVDELCRIYGVAYDEGAYNDFRQGRR